MADSEVRFAIAFRMAERVSAANYLLDHLLLFAAGAAQRIIE